MKKLLLFLIWFLFVLAFNVGHANAVPDIFGDYSGSDTTVVSNCAESGTYHGALAISISTQTGDTFSGTATITFEIDAIGHIQLSGTISESGQISGSTSHTFLGTGGVGTFTGQLSGNTLSIENPGHDTYGNTCTYIRYMSATLEPCQIFVADSSAPGDHSTNRGSIFQVSPVTGNWKVISSGGLFQNGPQDIEVDEQGDLIVTVDGVVGAPEAVMRIDRVTGTQTIISQGGFIDFFVGGLAIEKNGDLIVGNDGYGAQKLIRINSLNGNQSILTKWSNPNSGPNDIAIESNGQILVAGDGVEKRGDINYVTGAIYRVDPITGAYSIVSLGGELGHLGGIALDARGNIFVTNGNYSTNESQIVKVNFSTGSQSVISDSIPYGLRGIDVDVKGDLIVIAESRSSGLLLRVDPKTGAYEVISRGFPSPGGVTTTCVTTNSVTPQPPQPPPQPSRPKAMPWIPLLLTDD